jgi:hypothetical protein
MSEQRPAKRMALHSTAVTVIVSSIGPRQCRRLTTLPRPHDVRLYDRVRSSTKFAILT